MSPDMISILCILAAVCGLATVAGIYTRLGEPPTCDPCDNGEYPDERSY